jgi:hypothetical protein
VVLGLKGQISELELHTIRSRLVRGKLNKARRGELFINAPTGYVKTPADGLALAPDEQVRFIVRLIFDKFDELGTAHAVAAYLRQSHIRLGVRPHDGPNRGILEWRQMPASTVYRVLTHPAYAGTYAYGRTPIEPKRRRRNGQPGIRHAPMAEWAANLHGRRKVVLYSNKSRPRYECVTHLQPGSSGNWPGGWSTGWASVRGVGRLNYCPSTSGGAATWRTSSE